VYGALTAHAHMHKRGPHRYRRSRNDIRWNAILMLDSRAASARPVSPIAIPCPLELDRCESEAAVSAFVCGVQPDVVSVTGVPEFRHSIDPVLIALLVVYAIDDVLVLKFLPTCAGVVGIVVHESLLGQWDHKSNTIKAVLPDLAFRELARTAKD
jgi:hypothetical protein